MAHGGTTARTAAVLHSRNEQLLDASMCGDTETAQALLAAGAYMETKSGHGWTALICASDKGHTETAQALLAAGARLEAKNEYGDTALIRASNNGHAGTVAALLAAGANKEATDNFNRTALTCAIRQRRREVVALLDTDVPVPVAEAPLHSSPSGGALQAAAVACAAGVILPSHELTPSDPGRDDDYSNSNSSSSSEDDDDHG
jgi:ankyrin repeat protein